MSGVPLADGSYGSRPPRSTSSATPRPRPGVITPDLVIDTVGPVITGTFCNRLNGQVDYTIQDPSPASGRRRR